jgi:hypothetical protein
VLGRVLLAVIALAPIGARTNVVANPITYHFSGTFSDPRSGINGVNQFSGTFTIDGNPAVYGQNVYESGSDVSMNVGVGGQTFNLANDPLKQDASAYFSAGYIPLGASNNTFGQSVIDFNVSGAIQTATTQMTVSMGFYCPGGPAQLGNLSSLSFPLETSSVYVTETSGQQGQWADGVISSIELVSTTEPGSFVIFSAIAVAAMARRTPRRRGTTATRSLRGVSGLAPPTLGHGCELLESTRYLFIPVGGGM